MKLQPRTLIKATKSLAGDAYVAGDLNHAEFILISDMLTKLQQSIDGSDLNYHARDIDDQG